MRLLAYVVVTVLCLCLTSASSAQQATPSAGPNTGGVRDPNALPPVTSTPAAVSPAPGTVAPAPETSVGPSIRVEPTRTGVQASGVVSTTLAEPGSLITTGSSGPSAVVTDSKIARADAWVLFEQERDVRTQRGERVFFPLSLLAQAGFGGALAVVADDASTRSRALLGVSGGLALAALVPSMVASSRDARRAWFGVGSAAFALGLGASLVSLEKDHSKRDDNPSHGAENWIGAAVAVQGLAMLPVGLMTGFPSDNDYKAYAMLPAEARVDAAARLLAQIDRYEQRVTASLVLSNLLAVSILGMGAIVNDDKQERQALGAVAIAPLATALLIAVPRLFVASRTERFSLGQGPARLGFNAW